ncbi:MAG: D-glycero-beta-D-manno-heptose-7-phosphate kinase [Elusimicrobia bacterium]|nr:D-glycero-beta-D-manno-heptose-7-phosphate kinase [Elusimicrobiota bacterium]
MSIRLRSARLKAIVQKFTGRRILVLGDLILDCYLQGKARRLSPEAPVPVVRVEQEQWIPGGAGNVAVNLADLGAQVELVGIIGEDSEGARLKGLFSQRGISTAGLFCDPERPTSVKYRVIAEHQQVVRFDKEQTHTLSENLQQRLLRCLQAAISRSQCLVISDYGKGVISRRFLGQALRWGRREKRKVIVDPKVEHFLYYRRVTCLTPNLQEAIAGMRALQVEADGDVEMLGRRILAKLGLGSLIITRGEQGMTVFENGARIRVSHIPTQAREVFDVTGAGDTVVASLSLALAAGATLLEAAQVANAAAGIVVGKLGTATVSPAELAAVL